MMREKEKELILKLIAYAAGPQGHGKDLSIRFTEGKKIFTDIWIQARDEEFRDLVDVLRVDYKWKIEHPDPLLMTENQKDYLEQYY